ncbi:Glyoxalase-like domain protein [Bremerella volcania]|uniref:Glyoxalase-like domain protein n=1 Tax=Bremerella volcania TaxID=2527984 RepID=A0A518CCQ4_9BACT|nr:VOC family protein [Bremerella volcania]QDU77001.1 Glyoxalase-like domain protein [Bremerella volcania]
MREIIPGKLWIANARQARDIRSTLAPGVTAVIDLAIEETPITFPRDILYCRFPIVDGTGNPGYLLQACIETVAKLIEAHYPTVIACSAGMSRSPIIAAAAIAQVKGLALEDALLKLTETGPHDVSPALLNAVLDAMPSLATSHARLNLIVLRSSDPDATVRFYQALGLPFTQEQHGKGPIHWASETNRFVMEIYPAKSPEQVDTFTSVGLNVSDIHRVMQLLIASDMKITSEPKEFDWGIQAIVKDPDGRSVILVER